MGKISQKLGNKEERCKLHLVSGGVAGCDEPKMFAPYLDTRGSIENQEFLVLLLREWPVIKE